MELTEVAWVLSHWVLWISNFLDETGLILDLPISQCFGLGHSHQLLL